MVLLIGVRGGVSEHHGIKLIANSSQRERLSVWQFNDRILCHSCVIGVVAAEYDLRCNDFKVLGRLTNLNFEEGEAESVNLSVDVGQASIRARDLSQLFRLA